MSRPLVSTNIPPIAYWPESNCSSELLTSCGDIPAGLPTIGVPLIDSQHQALFHWVDELEHALQDKRALFAAYTLRNLFAYAIDHFQVEEEVMAAHDFPLLAQHRLEHQAFQARLETFASQTLCDEVALALVGFLRRWLIEHIGKSDSKLIPYLEAAAA